MKNLGQIFEGGCCAPHAEDQKRADVCARREVVLGHTRAAALRRPV